MLRGTAIAVGDGTLTYVETRPFQCQGSVAPQDCEATPNLFVSTSPSEITGTAINLEVLQGQTIDVTVKLSFS
jgi:hypothetical protein